MRRNIYIIILLIIFLLSSCLSLLYRIDEKKLEDYKWVWYKEEIQIYWDVEVIAFITNEINFYNNELYLRVKEGWYSNNRKNCLLKTNEIYSMPYKIKKNQIIK